LNLFTLIWRNLQRNPARSVLTALTIALSTFIFLVLASVPASMDRIVKAEAAAMGLLHARLLVQSIVNAFVDTYRYQAALGVAALLLVLLFHRGRPLASLRHWIVQIVR